MSKEHVFKKNVEDLKRRFEEIKKNNPNEGRYRCWDCEKEITNPKIEESKKEKLGMDIEGYKLLICKECGEKEHL